MEVQPDFKDLLVLFNNNKVEYLLVGGYALAFHGAPRFTGDMDIFVKPDPQNAKCIINALTQFGFGSLDVSPLDFESPGKIVQLGVPPVRIDIITSTTGVSWEDAVSGKVDGKYGDIPVSYMGREEFISNKKAMGRKKDLADVEALGEG
ncbi:MAG: nucleotidyl transferase AbiEii/AbiGii toxin family protein [Chlamydiae bacterium]|nr:nucleotidyl transferase AbiEii/AbiGii toxin family protein [Chlamydiota bacterium]MBI3277036.1 nucleotidyl transferase AbiEii/AbiGii toxin family protein [Chlamydiota bacterium]